MRLLILLGALLLASTAWCQDEIVDGPYFGIGLGTFDYEFTLGPTSFSFSDSVAIRNLYGGYRFGERWAVEGFLSDTSTVNAAPTPFTSISLDYDILGVRGLAHFRNFFVGVGYWSADVDVSSNPPTSVFLSTDSDISVILGGEWSFKDNWGLRLDYELFDMDRSSQSDIEALSLGVHYNFGKR
jgi:hypothetical protein